jgi:aryl-alcohol dehydrogenase-like predicted oxidoreductase
MKLGLGTVQFGFDYGVANFDGRVTESEAHKILVLAADNGMEVIDTAAAYGESEAVLGRCLPRSSNFRIVTKTCPMRECNDRAEGSRWVLEGFGRSLENLLVDRVDALLVHHISDLLGPGGCEIVDTLVDLKRSGRVSKIGFSAYGAADIDAAMAIHDFDLVQLPLNVFDQRLIAGGQLSRLKNQGLEVHVRSVFLQGLLLMDLPSVPDYFAPITPKIKAWHRALAEQGLTLLEGAFAFVRTLDVDVVLIGVDSASQLLANQKAFAVASECNLDFTNFAVNDEAFINPSRWRLSK